MKQSKITDFFKNLTNNFNDLNNFNDKIVYGYNPKTNSWHCTKCGIDIGENNPRQLCEKIYCKYVK